jgi:S-DNA-T family DNA segregation ATPase FtsK/SpoIIIE
MTIAPPRSPLPGMVAAELHLAVANYDSELAAPTDTGRPTLLLIDDAEAIEDDEMVLDRLLAAHGEDLLVVAAARADSLRGTFSHWTRAVRRSKLGLLLQPATDLDGELLGVNLPRRPSVAMSAGRGFLVNGGELDIVQVARPTVHTNPVET